MVVFFLSGAFFHKAEDAKAVGACFGALNLIVGGPSELASILSVTSAVSAGLSIGLPMLVSAIPVSNSSVGSNWVASRDPRQAAFAAGSAEELGADFR